MKKKTGLALGSGASRGGAHIGVLKALDEAGIGIDFIAGTSIGSVVGAVYSLGKLKEFEQFVSGLTWKSIVSYVDLSIPSSGLIPGKKVFKMLSEYFKDYMIEDLPIPYCAVAADVTYGDEVRFTKGPVSDAVRASVAIPGIFTPFMSEGRALVDGGIVNPVPVNIVKEMGADVVIAVDLNSCLIDDRSADGDSGEGMDVSRKKKTADDPDGRDHRILDMLEEKYRDIAGSIREKISSLRAGDESPNILEIIDNATHIMQRSISENQFRISRPDILIEPQLGDFRLFDFDRAEEAIEEGYRLMKEQIPDLEKIR